MWLLVVDSREKTGTFQPERFRQSLKKHARKNKEGCNGSLFEAFVYNLLLERGVDFRYIQELLGHKHSKTTEIYTHMNTKDLNKIRSDGFDRR